MKKGCRVKSVFVLSVFSIPVFCADIGSDTAPTRFNTKQTVNDGDRIAGFAALEGGFEIVGSTATGTFDSFFPVSSGIELNCGTLILNRDFIFGDVAEFTSLGNITGQRHTMEFSATVTLVPFGTGGAPEDCSCYLNGLIDSASECGEVWTVDWSHDDQFIITGLACECYDRLKIYSFSGTELTQRLVSTLGSTSVVYTIRWRPNSYQFAVGRPYPAGGSEFRIFEFNPELDTINEKSVINFNRSVKAVSWHPSGDYLAIAMDDSSKEIAVYSVNSGGIINVVPIAVVNLNPSNFVTRQSMDWSANGDYLVVGTDNPYYADELRVYEFDDVGETLLLNASHSFGHHVYSVSWNKTYTWLLGAGTNGGTERLFVFEHNGTAGTLTQRASSGNEVYTTPSVNAIDWSPDGLCLVIGTQYASASDRIHEFQTFSYNRSTYELKIVSSVSLADDTKDVRWSHDGKNIALGSDIQQLRVYSSGCDCADGCVVFSDLNLFTNNDVTFRNCCITFDGESLISGRGNCLTFLPTCTIRIGNGASLQLKDLTLKGLDNNNFGCLDNLGTVSFHDVHMVLDNDYSFTVGRMDVVKDLKVSGEEHTFSYRSTEESFIRERGRLIMENDTTFSYDPLSASNQLINLTAETSEIRLNGATLHATSTGLVLTKGILSVDRNSFVSSDAVVEAEAIMFGDGVDIANDLQIQELPAGNLDIVQGIALFNNVGG